MTLAPKKISALSVADPASSSDYIPIVQGGSSKRMPARKTSRTVTTHTTAYELVLTDADAWLYMIDGDDATAMCGVDIPAHADVPLPLDVEITVVAKSTGGVSINAGVGVTVHPSAPCYIPYQWGAVVLKQIATDEWLAVGARPA